MWETYCFKYYYYLIQALFMLILESLLFPHCSSYPSDSLKAHLYNFSKTKQNKTPPLLLCLLLVRTWNNSLYYLL